MKKILVLILALNLVAIAGCSNNSKYFKFNNSNPIASFVDDKTTAVRVSSALGKDKELWNKSHLNIVSHKNSILVIGQTPSKKYKKRIDNIISNIARVEDIYNEVEVTKPTSLMTRTKDSWITAQVKAKLLAEPNLASNNIRVVTENKIVYLMGSPTKKEQEKALDIATSINGVKQVIDVFSEKS